MTDALVHSSGMALDRIAPDAILAVVKVRDEAWRLPFWLSYHRWLGVDHFVVIDNRSADILHYKLDADLPEKTANAVIEGQYFSNSIEYRTYEAALNLAGGTRRARPALQLRTAASRRFTGLDSLMEAGLCHFAPGLRAEAAALSVSADRAENEIRAFGFARQEIPLAQIRRGRE